MTVPGCSNPLLMYGDAGAFQVSRSLRYNAPDSSYLSRTPSVAGNRKTWTWSGWVKRSALGTYQQIFSTWTGSAASAKFSLGFYNNDKLVLAEGAGVAERRSTTQVFRDPSAFFHLLVAADTTQATANDRFKIYVNGSQITAFDTLNNPGQNDDTAVNQIGGHAVGGQIYASSSYNDFFSGYLADVFLIDGQQLTPSSFTEVSATTGQLIPKAYTGSYGTNGFYLKFADNSTTAALGTDSSGNGNTWTTNNFSVTAGAGNDSLVDTPTSYGTDTGVGGEVRGNYATSNPLDNGGQTLANGNLDITGIASNWRGTRGTIGMSSGKWYWEVTISFTNSGSNQSLLGIATNAASISGNYASAGAYGWEYYSSNGNKFNNGSNPGYGASYTSGDVIGIAFDADSGALTFYKNGSSQGTAYTGLTSGPYFPSFSLYGTSLVSFNAGQRAFAYTAPSGFKALCDTNLGAPLTAKPNTVFDVALYTGNGGTQTLSTTANFQPGLVWLKARSSTSIMSHNLQDVVRGTGANALLSDSTAGESTYSEGTISAFNATNVTLSSSLNGARNANGASYVGWIWNAGTSTVSNTAGSITSQVRANASAGFSVATWTGTGSGSATVGHGLGVAPRMMIVKDRSNARNWLVYHITLGASSGVALNSTVAASGADAGWWNNTSPTSTVATIGTYGNESANYVGYFWTPVVGYSSFGSYTGNGSSDGPFVYTGFRPRWIMVKSTGSAENWFLLDTARNTYNAVNSYLMPNSSSAEDANNSTVNTDFLSNGFKLRATTSALNTNAIIYIYAAFAENPFQYARAR